MRRSTLKLVRRRAPHEIWHRGFVAGLLLDWLVVCELASVSTAVAIGAA
jgi:hypothetical protein